MLTNYRSNIKSFFDEAFLNRKYDLWDRWFPEDKYFSGSFFEKCETEKAVSYLLDVPGMSKDQLTITHEGNVVSVVGERTNRATKYAINAAFSIDPRANQETLVASLENGVLNISFILNEAAKPKEIEPKTVKIQEKK